LHLEAILVEASFPDNAFHSLNEDTPMNMNSATDGGIALLGASGRSGQAILKLCLERGIPVSALSRSGNLGIDNTLLRIVKGDAKDSGAIKALVQGRCAIVSALGRRPGEPPLFSDSAKAVIEAARACAVKRYIGLTGLSLTLPDDVFSFSQRIQSTILHALYPGTLADRDESVRLILHSGLDWTLLRLPLIVPDLPERGYILDRERPCGKMIGARDVATVVLDMLSNGDNHGCAPFAASWKEPASLK
jgi:putative NADH-flavin reductase